METISEDQTSEEHTNDNNTDTNDVIVEFNEIKQVVEIKSAEQENEDKKEEKTKKF